MQSKPKTVAEFLVELPDDRRKTVQALRKTIRKNLPEGYKEGIINGELRYYVPHSIYPAGYHRDPKMPLLFAGINSLENYILLGIHGVSEHDEWFREAWAKTGKKLDPIKFNKFCIRIKKIEDVPLDVIGQAVRRVPVEEFVADYESTLSSSRKRPTKAK
jgi:Domain of unknown function (DU1801)